jgi:tetratricopeptide (TPR) repeat protein
VALIVLAGTCTYWNSLEVPFLWDDQTAIVTNRSIRDFRPPWRPLLPPLETPVAGRPIVNLSFALNYATAGLDVTAYHAWNLGVHLLAALLLFGVIRRTLGSERLGGRFGADAANVALVAALWWLLHPMVSEVINYTTQRTTSMKGLFFLLTLYCAIRALDSMHRTRWHVLAVLACVCGMASKESMVAAPIVVMLYDRIFAFPTLREALRARKHLYWALAATWGGLGAMIWLWPRSTVGFAASVDPWTYALNQAQLIPRYLRLAVWPNALVLDYGLPQALAVSDVVGSGLFVLALLGGTLVALLRWPMIGFLGAVFFLTLAPTTSFIPIATEVGAERRMYLPLAAVAVLLVLAGRDVFRRARSLCPANAGRLVTTTAFTVTTVWLTSAAVATTSRNAQYADPVALWHSSVERRPHGRVRLTYATALINAGKPDLALSQLREAVRDYPEARYALGTELAVRDDRAAAIHELQTFIDDKPLAATRVPARLLLGRLLAADGRFEDSASQFRFALKLSPSNLDAHASLGDLLMAQKRYLEAASHYRAIIASRSDQVDSHIKLGRALDSGGEPAQAMDAYRKALQLDPASHVAHLSLADLCLRLDRVDEAIVYAREAVRLEPRGGDAHHLLGAALARDGRLAEAVEHFRAALELDPGNQQARLNLTRAADLLRGASLTRDR